MLYVCSAQLICFIKYRLQAIDYDPVLARTTERVLDKIVEVTGILPDNLFIQQAKKEGDNPVAGGGFADVWKGEVKGETISLKVIRVFDMTVDLQKVR